MTYGIPPAHTTEDETAVLPLPINLELAQTAVCDFLSKEPEAAFKPAGYDTPSIARTADMIELLDTVPFNSVSKYTGDFLNFGEVSPRRRCEIHAVNVEDGPSWAHFAAIDPKLKIFSDHIIAELMLCRSGTQLSPLDLFTMAMFTRFGGIRDAEIQPDSVLRWTNDIMNVSFLYPESDSRTNPLKTYQLGFMRFRNLDLAGEKFDAYIRTVDKSKGKPRGKKRWIGFALPPIVDPLSVCLAG